ncbi:MAG: hypothetical protein RLZZ568_888 [Cyanobacteriota bacterium]|jgi:hypothetical protein
MTVAHPQENHHILQTVSLLTAYCFDLRGLAPTQLTDKWLRHFSAFWIRLAVIEALYLGRYKAISVEHLLQFWQGKGQPRCHFPPEFEQMVSQKLPKSLTPITEAVKTEFPPSPKIDPNPPQKVPNSLKQSSSPGNSLAQPSSPTTTSFAPKPAAKRRFSPSIEQFIPITVESDLWHKLQSALNSPSEPVRQAQSIGAGGEQRG